MHRKFDRKFNLKCIGSSLVIGWIRSQPMITDDFDTARPQSSPPTKPLPRSSAHSAHEVTTPTTHCTSTSPDVLDEKHLRVLPVCRTTTLLNIMKTISTIRPANKGDLDIQNSKISIKNYTLTNKSIRLLLDNKRECRNNWERLRFKAVMTR